MKQPNIMPRLNDRILTKDATYIDINGDPVHSLKVSFEAFLGLQLKGVYTDDVAEPNVTVEFPEVPIEFALPSN
jgi:hypothetical protein